MEIFAEPISSWNYCNKQNRTVPKLSLKQCIKKFRKIFQEKLRITKHIFYVINRLGEAVAVLKTPLWLINSFSWSSFCSESLKNCVSQTLRAWKLKFFKNVNSPPCVRYNVSHVRYEVSGGKCIHNIKKKLAFKVF